MRKITNGTLRRLARLDGRRHMKKIRIEYEELPGEKKKFAFHERAIDGMGE